MTVEIYYLDSDERDQFLDAIREYRGSVNSINSYVNLISFTAEPQTVFNIAFKCGLIRSNKFK